MPFSVTLRSGLHRKKCWAILRGTGISESIRAIAVSSSLRGMLAGQAPAPKLRDNRKRPSKRWNFKRPIDRPAHDNQRLLGTPGLDTDFTPGNQMLPGE